MDLNLCALEPHPAGSILKPGLSRARPPLTSGGPRDTQSPSNATAICFVKTTVEARAPPRQQFSRGDVIARKRRGVGERFCHGVGARPIRVASQNDKPPATSSV